MLYDSAMRYLSKTPKLPKIPTSQLPNFPTSQLPEFRATVLSPIPPQTFGQKSKKQKVKKWRNGGGRELVGSFVLNLFIPRSSLRPLTLTHPHSPTHSLSLPLPHPFPIHFIRGENLTARTPSATVVSISETLRFLHSQAPLNMCNTSYGYMCPSTALSTSRSGKSRTHTHLHLFPLPETPHPLSTVTFILGIYPPMGMSIF